MEQKSLNDIDEITQCIYVLIFLLFTSVHGKWFCILLYVLFK